MSSSVKKECTLYIPYIITALLLTSLLFAKTLDKGLYLTWLSAVGISLVTATFFSKTEILKVTLFDVIIIIFVSYTALNYSLLTSNNFTQYFFWVYASYPLVFYLFHKVLKHKNERKKITTFFFSLIKALAIVQATIGFLQYFEIISVTNSYFKFIGSFTTKNPLAIFLSFGVILTSWSLFIEKAKGKWILVFNLSVLILSSIAILIIQSRTTWLALIIGFTILLLTSKKNKIHFTNRSFFLKSFIGIGIITILAFGSYFAYGLKKDSADARRFIAERTLNQVIQKPYFGHGLLTFKENYNKAKSAYFIETPRPWSETKIGSFTYTAFNEYLKVLNELGLIGFLLIVVAIIIILKNYTENHLSRISLILISMVFLFSLFSYPADLPHVMAIALFAMAIIKAEGKDHKVLLTIDKPILNKARPILNACVGFFIIYVCFSKLIANNSLNRYYINYSAGIDEVELINLYNKYNEIGNSNFYLGKELYRLGNKKEGLELMEKGFNEKPLPKFGTTLAKYYQKEFNYKRAEELYKFNIGNEPFRFQHLSDLAQLMNYSNRINDMQKYHHQIISLPEKVPSKGIDSIKERSCKYYNLYKQFEAAEYKIKGSLSIDKYIQSRIYKREMNYKVYLPAIKHIQGRLPVIYIVDGQQYLKETQIIKQLDNLIEKGNISPVIIVFIDPRDVNDKSINRRNEYFFCNDNYINFFAKELLPHCESYYPVSKRRNERTIVGHSFGGLFAAYLGFKQTDLFSKIVMQSPAFYPCPDIYNLYKKQKKLDLNIYMSYGTRNDTEEQDLPMIDILTQKGYGPKINRVEGADHTWELWKSEIENILNFIN